MAKARDKQALESHLTSALMFTTQQKQSDISVQPDSDTREIEVDCIVPYHREKIVCGDEEFSIFYDYPAEKLQQLADNIYNNGLLEPIIVFPSLCVPGKYEVLSGKQRTNAVRIIRTRNPDQAQWAKIKARVLDAQKVSADDYAYGDTVYVTTNLERRDHLKISELAMAYEMEVQARKHMGKKVDGASNVNEELAQRINKPVAYVRNVRRIQPQFLIKDFVEMVDESQLNLSTAALYISYLSHTQQKMIYAWAYHRLGNDQTGARAYLAKKLTRVVCKAIKTLLEAKGEDGKLTDEELESFFESREVSFQAPSAQMIKSIVPARLWGESQDTIVDFLQAAVAEYLDSHPEKK